eukprot:g3762.t1
MSNSVILATAGYDHTIRFWKASNGVCYRTLQFSDSQVNRLQITPNKKYIAAVGNPNVRLFEIDSGNPNPVYCYDGHTASVTSVGFHKDSTWMYTSSEDGTIKIWDLRARGCQRDYECRAPVNTVVLHPNQAELVSGDRDGMIKVWDLTANKCVKEFSPEGNVSIQSASMAADASLLVAATAAGRCFLWRPRDSYKPLYRFKAHNGYILKCELSPDLRHLATASSDHTAKIWKLENCHPSSKSVYASPPDNEKEKDEEKQRKEDGDEKKVKNTLDDGKISLNDTNVVTKKVPNTLHVSRGETQPQVNVSLYKNLAAHEKWVWDCVFSADSSYLVTASSDFSARLWEVRRGVVVRHYTGHHKAVVAVALNDSGGSGESTTKS